MFNVVNTFEKIELANLFHISIFPVPCAMFANDFPNREALSLLLMS